jgi:hypothetical protein
VHAPGRLKCSGWYLEKARLERKLQSHLTLEMTMSLRKIAGLMVLSATIFGSGAVLAQDATVDQVYQAVHSGHYAEAQAMLDKVLKDKPNSYEAHYIEAELLARQGKFGEAQAELSTAERINPALPKIKPTAVQELQQQINQGVNAGRAPAPRPAYNPPAAAAPAIYQQQRQSSGMPWGILIGIVLLIVFIVMIARAFGRRNMVVGAPGGYGGGFGGAGYGPGGMPMGGGYGGGYPMGGGGIGSGIVGGLATGAALGAGMVAGEELVHHFTDGNRGDNYSNQGGGGGWDNSPPANSDMGGNDFGISDGGSFDGGGGGDSGGGGDWN